jgi:RNA-directed DNA polymerase
MFFQSSAVTGTCCEVRGRNTVMNEHGKSDSCVVSAKLLNNSIDLDGGKVTTQKTILAEAMEKRQLAKGNLQEQNARRIQGRVSAQSALERIRDVAVRDNKQRFTALMHHIYSIDMLEEAYFNLERKASAGIDGVTWRHYGENLKDNLRDLSLRLKRGAYQAKPVKRTYIPKADGQQRALGLPVLEDKIVQSATAAVLGTIYEKDFLGFSYGYRPKRSQHHCLDALYVGLQTKKVSYVLDADIQGFFDNINHSWLIKFIEHRIADKRVVRLIIKWLTAGIMEEGKWYCSEEGTPAGGVISPLLANVYLHYVFDLWMQRWRASRERGDIIVVRWADDFIVGFQTLEVAKQFLTELHTRFEKFSLTLHPGKTRLIEFGPFAIKNSIKRGTGKPESFNFLGYTHFVGKKRSNGMFTVIRKSIRKKMRAKLKEVKVELKRRMHEPVPEVGKWLKSIVGGYNRYFGVPTNMAALHTFRFQVGQYWFCTLKRRSQKSLCTWERMRRLIERWLPKPEIHHPYPLLRKSVST